MSQFPESAFEDGREGRSFLSLLAITAVLVTAGISLALFMAAG
jgi:hypothetical protein